MFPFIHVKANLSYQTAVGRRVSKRSCGGSDELPVRSVSAESELIPMCVVTLLPQKQWSTLNDGQATHLKYRT
jgi:hypothetical protein